MKAFSQYIFQILGVLLVHDMVDQTEKNADITLYMNILDWQFHFEND